VFLVAMVVAIVQIARWLADGGPLGGSRGG